MSFYLILDLAVLSIPLILSFDKKVTFYKKWPFVGGTILVTGAVYVIWDILVTRAGHWSFNPEYTGSFRIAGLPVGEWLFFIIVPYSCLFIYEVLRAYLKERTFSIHRWVPVILAVAALANAVIFIDQDYTFLVMCATALFFASMLFFPNLLNSSYTWLYLGVCYVPFLIANGVLTALPIVTYNSMVIWNMRVYTIPLEDFFYSFTLLGFSLIVYRFFLDKFEKRATP